MIHKLAATAHKRTNRRSSEATMGRKECGDDEHEHQQQQNRKRTGEKEQRTEHAEP